MSIAISLFGGCCVAISLSVRLAVCHLDISKGKASLVGRSDTDRQADVVGTPRHAARLELLITEVYIG